MSDWPEARISELATIDIGGTPSRAIPAFWSEKPSGFPWISIADLKGKYVSDTKEHITALGVRSSNVKLIPELTTVMSFKLTVGRTAITATDMYCNEAIAIFQPKDDRLDARWLYHALPRAAGSVVTDTAVKGATLNKAKMAEMLLQLPPPAEQAIIARVLDTLDTAIHETQAIIAKLKAVKQGLLHDLLTRGIGANGELRPHHTEAPHLYKQSPLGWIPKGWEFVRLAEKLSVLGGKRLPAGHSYADHPTAFKYLRVTDFFERDYTLDELENLHQRTFKALERYEIRSGQLFISIAGSLGYVGVHRSEVDTGIRTILTENAARLVPLEELVPEFVAAYMNSSMVQVQVTAEKGTGGGVPKLALFRIEQFWLGWPDKEEQVQISQCLRTVSERIRSEVEFVRKLNLEKSGLMDDLLTGRVRVTPLLAAAPEGSA